MILNKRELLIAAGLVIVFAVYVWHDNSVLSNVVMRADSASAVALSREVGFKAQVLADSGVVIRLNIQRDSALVVAAQAARRAPQIVERIIQVAGDSAAVVAKVDTLVIEHAQEVSGLRLALVSADSIIQRKDYTISAALGVNADLESALRLAGTALHKQQAHDTRNKVIAGAIILGLVLTR